MNTYFSLRRMPMLGLLAAYILGLLLQVHLWSSLSPVWLVLVSLLLFAATMFFSRPAYFTVFNLPIAHTMLMLAMVVLGMSSAASGNPTNDARWYGHFIHQAEAFVVRLLENPSEKARTFLLPVSVERAYVEGRWQPMHGRVQLYVYKQKLHTDYTQGQTLVVANKLQAISHNNNPGSFDFAAKLRREGIYHQAFLAPGDISVLQSRPSPGIIPDLRALLLHQLDTFIPDSKTRALTMATLLNEDEHLDKQMSAEYANTGISHIIAISGMHVNLLFALMVLPLFWIKDKRRLWLKYLLVLPFVWLYVSLCRFPPSAVRAAIGFTLITVSLLLRRPQNNLHLLSLNALIMLLVNPYWLFHVGVQLSFLAVLSIFLFYQPIKRVWTPRYLIVRWVWDTVAVSLSVQVLVFPLVIYYFHQFPVWFLGANVLAAVFSLCQMLMAFLIMFFGLIGWAGIAAFVGSALTAITLKFNAVIAWMNAHSWDLSRLIPLDAFDYWLLMAAIIALSVFGLRKKLIALYVGLCLLLGFGVNLLLQDWQAMQRQKLVVYAGANQSCLEYISGKSAQAFLSDTMSTALNEYILRPSALHHRLAQRQLHPVENKYWRVGERRIAFLANAAQLPQEGLDVVILSRAAQLDAALLKDLWPDALVVLDASFGRGQAERYRNELKATDIKVFSVPQEGAWWCEKK